MNRSDTAERAVIRETQYLLDTALHLHPETLISELERIPARYNTDAASTTIPYLENALEQTTAKQAPLLHIHIPGYLRLHHAQANTTALKSLLNQPV